MQQGSESALRTRFYIDGYNLYYGCLKGSTHKWLDPRALIERILLSVLYERNGSPVGYRLQTPAIKYFTASILKSFARSDDSVACQANYHSALQGYLGEELEIVKGYYDARIARAHRWEKGKNARECERLEIWKLEEKQSDVGLALHAFSDTVRNEVDQIVVVTNDTDFVPAMKMIRQHTQAVIGLIAPIKPHAGNVNAQLERHAHWTRQHIREEEFAQSQLPPMVRGKNNVIHKPLSWYPRPDLLIPIYAEAKRVKCSEGAARKWLNQPCSHLEGRIPIEMCSAEATARELRYYMDQYAKEFGV